MMMPLGTREREPHDRLRGGMNAGYVASSNGSAMGAAAQNRRCRLFWLPASWVFSLLAMLKRQALHNSGNKA
jgi:hypothetical protein